MLADRRKPRKTALFCRIRPFIIARLPGVAATRPMPKPSEQVSAKEPPDSDEETWDLEDEDASVPVDLTETPVELADPAVPAVTEMSSAAESSALVPTTTLQRYLAEVRRYPFLSKEEELRLFHEYQAKGSREAAVTLILSNLRVSVSIAAEYLHTGADHMDLIQEGNVGLMQAIRKFDPTKNVRFYAYAAWWVRAYILRYLLNTYRLVKVGTTQDQRKLFYNLKKERAKLEREGFTPDAKLLADRLNVRERDVIEMDQRLGSWELSLDQPLGPDTEGTLLDVLPAPEAAADEALGQRELRLLFRRKLAEFAHTLDERDEDILRNRLLSETPLTLDDLGQKYGITKERTRQLEARIISKLRAFMKKDIKDFEQLRD